MYFSSCAPCSLITLWLAENWYACITSEPTKKSKLVNSKRLFRSSPSNSTKISIRKMPKNLSKGCTVCALPKLKRKAITNWLWLHSANWPPVALLPTMWLRKLLACMSTGQLLMRPMAITLRLFRSLISCWKVIPVIRLLNLKSAAWFKIGLKSSLAADSMNKLSKFTKIMPSAALPSLSTSRSWPFTRVGAKKWSKMACIAMLIDCCIIWLKSNLTTLKWPNILSTCLFAGVAIWKARTSLMKPLKLYVKL